MNNNLFNPHSVFLNSVFIGKEVGNHLIDLEFRQIIAANQTRDALLELGKIQLVSLYGQRESLHLQNDTNINLGNINRGIDNLSDKLSDGFGTVNHQITELSKGVQGGFHQVGIGLQTGFQAVVKGLYHIDERLGQRLMAGFSSLNRHMSHIHWQLMGSLTAGFNTVIDSIDQAAKQTIESVRAMHSDLAKRLDEISYQQRQLVKRLDEISYQQRHSDAIRAEEHFMVGMNFLNNADFSRARDQFRKACETYAGYFPTLFAEGFCCCVLDDSDSAYDSFEASLSQTDADPILSGKQKSLSSLYLGRIAFDRSQYDLSRRWYYQAYRNNEMLCTALAEGAASLLLDQSRTDRKTDASAVKQEFNRFGSQAYLYWYILALTLAPLKSDLAKEAFRHGAYGDYRVKTKDRVALISLLWQLNPRNASILTDLVKNEFSWLNSM